MCPQIIQTYSKQTAKHNVRQKRNDENLKTNSLRQFITKEIACTKGAADHLAFLQDIRRHELPIHSKRFNSGNRYDLVSFCISMCVHELREYQLSLAAIGRLLRQVDLNELSIKTEQFP